MRKKLKLIKSQIGSDKPDKKLRKISGGTISTKVLKKRPNPENIDENGQNQNNSD